MLEVELKAALLPDQADVLPNVLAALHFAEQAAVQETDIYFNAPDRDFRKTDEKLSAYTIYVGNTVNECEEYVWRRMETFRRTCGEPTGPMMRSTFRTLHEADKQRMVAEFLQKMHWDQRLPQIDFDDPG